MIQESTAPLVGALACPRFEVIPVKGLDEQVGHLPPGATVTVTCSPARGIEHTLGCAERLAGRGLRVVPHISARLVADEAHLRGIVRRLAALGLREIFVVGGDVTEPVGPFHGALDLLHALADLDHGLAEIGVTAYPERHPFIDHPTPRRVLADKQRFATYMVTQICFDPGAIAAWLADARRAGIVMPAYIGLPGVVDKAKLLGISMKIGVGDSARFISKHMDVAARLLLPGSYRPTELVEKLAPYLGDPHYTIRGLHLNTFNQIEGTETWRQEMLASARRGHDR